MAKELPVVTMNGKKYFLDIRMGKYGQLRTHTTSPEDGPIEFIDIDDLPDEDYYQIQDEYMKALDAHMKTIR